MKAREYPDLWLRLVIILLLLWPLMLLLLAPGAAATASAVVFWLALLGCFLLIFFMLGMPEAPLAPAHAPEPRMLPESQQPDAVRQVMAVHVAVEGADGVRVFRGRLRESADVAYQTLKRAFTGGTVPMLQEDEQTGAAVVLLPTPVEQRRIEHPTRPAVHWLLFALTIVTTTWAGAAHEGVNLMRDPGRFAVGLPYAVGLMAILGIHELGHYFMARRHGITVTPPYFIPVPFALGTFGAFIQMRSPTEDRRSLFDVAVAGPLAGLAVAIPALLIGLRSSTIVPGDVGEPMMRGTSVGSSLLLALLAKASLGPALEYGHVLRLSPLAFAGWLGLFVTALNLLPIGQLDGGHMATAMFGRRVGGTVGTVAMWTLLLLAIFVWPGLTMWAILVFFIAGTSAAPLNDLTPLTPERQWVGYGTFAVLALILAPLPHSLWSAAGIHCPYV